MSKTEHISTPCKLDIRRKGIDLYDADGRLLATMPATHVNTAEVVCCACNSHAALVEALENLLVAAREEQLAWGHTSIRTNCYLDAQKAAIEALATAKGE